MLLLILLKTIRRKVDCCFQRGSAAVLRSVLSKNLAPLQALAYLSLSPAKVLLTLEHYLVPVRKPEARQGPFNPGTDEYELTDSETEYHSGSETEPTDVDDNVDEVIEDVEDAEGRIDCAYLLADEVHPPEYYLKQMEEFDES